MRSNRLAASALALVMLSACGRGGSSAHPSSEEDKTYYAIGVILGQRASQFHMTPAEIEMAKAGFGDAAAGRTPEVDVQAYAQKANQLLMSRGAEESKKRAEADAPFRAAAAKEEGARATPSGLIIRTLTPGTGKSPTASDTVKVHYTGRLSDGTVFDSSVERGQPATFPLSGVVKCWTEGIAQMKVGEKARLTCPAEIAYGDRGFPPKIPGGATLVEAPDLTPTPYNLEVVTGSSFSSSAGSGATSSSTVGPTTTVTTIPGTNSSVYQLPGASTPPPPDC